jgi:D,D-heptose 1,7-bisphosphate phosphatase
LINSYSYFDEEFLIVYGDTYFDINIFEFYRFHSSKNSDLSLFTHPNDHPFDSDIVVTDCNDRVINISGYPHSKDFFSANIVNAAFFICNKRVFQNHKFKESFFYDFVKDLIPVFISENYYVFSYLSKEYIKDCGTVQRIIQVESDINNNIPRKCSLGSPKSTIFIDRDGTLIKDVGHLNNFRDIVIFEDVFSNLVKLNKFGFLTCLITNQPVIARGDLSFSGLAEVHNYLEWELGKHGAYLDLIEFCPHHPDSGYEGEIPFLKIKCECRKPEIGLFKNVEAKYEIDYNNSWMIGDSTSDILAGNRFGIKTILLLTGEQGLDGKYECNPSFIADSFFSAVEIILKFKS